MSCFLCETAIVSKRYVRMCTYGYALHPFQSRVEDLSCFEARSSAIAVLCYAVLYVHKCDTVQ